MRQLGLSIHLALFDWSSFTLTPWPFVPYKICLEWGRTELLEVVARRRSVDHRASAYVPTPGETVEDVSAFGSDKVMLWTKRWIQAAAREGIGSKCLHLLIFVQPRCISISSISFKIIAVYGVCGDWGVKEEAFFHLIHFCNLYKKKDQIIKIFVSLTCTVE